MEKSRCRSCRAEIIWVRSAKTQALMPLDAEPSEKGNIVLVDGLAVVRGNGDLFEPMLAESPRYINHFATCVHAAQHRKPKAKK